VVRLMSALLMIIMLLAACNSSAPAAEEDINVAAVLAEAIANIRAAERFGLLVEQEGQPYRFRFQIGADALPINTSMSRAEGHFVSPDALSITARLAVGRGNVDVGLFAKGDTQWLRISATVWQQFDFAEGFNPGQLMAEDSGFQRALSRLENLAYQGRKNRLGRSTFHITGKADGEVINDLLFGLVAIEQETTLVDVFVDTETRLPTELILLLPDTATADNPEDTFWRIEIFDVNQDVEIDKPSDVEL